MCYELTVRDKFIFPYNRSSLNEGTQRVNSRLHHIIEYILQISEREIGSIIFEVLAFLLTFEFVPKGEHVHKDIHYFGLYYLFSKDKHTWSSQQKIHQISAFQLISSLFRNIKLLS